jgi:hypothetical protein
VIRCPDTHILRGDDGERAQRAHGTPVVKKGASTQLFFL